MEDLVDPTELLKQLRAAKQRWVNAGRYDEHTWEMVEAFETLDLILLEGGELPEDWKAPAPRRN